MTTVNKLLIYKETRYLSESHNQTCSACWAVFFAGNNTWKSTDHDFESHLTWAYNIVSLTGDWEPVQEANIYSWSNPAVEHNVRNPLRLLHMFGGCQRYWHIVAVSCSSTCTDNLWEESRQCVYLAVKVGVTGEAPHGHFSQWEDCVMVTLWQEH